MLHGGSSKSGVILGLYSEQAIDQYAWPIERLLIFWPLAILLVVITSFKIWQVIRPGTMKEHSEKIPHLSGRMVDLMTGMGFIGALSIWPAKIGVIYAFFIFLALFAFTRINRGFNLRIRINELIMNLN